MLIINYKCVNFFYSFSVFYIFLHPMSYALCLCLGQPVHLPSSAIVYGTVKSEIVLEIVKELRALSFNASVNEFINMVLSSVYQRWLLMLTYSFVTVAHVGNHFSVTSSLEEMLPTLQQFHTVSQWDEYKLCTWNKHSLM